MCGDMKKSSQHPIIIDLIHLALRFIKIAVVVREYDLLPDFRAIDKLTAGIKPRRRPLSTELVIGGRT